MRIALYTSKRTFRHCHDRTSTAVSLLELEPGDTALSNLFLEFVPMLRPERIHQ